MIRHLRRAIDHLWDTASRGVWRLSSDFSRGLPSDPHCRGYQISILRGYSEPIAWARAISFKARCTTGGSIIFEPRLTTAKPFSCASLYAVTILLRALDFCREGANAS